MLSAILCVLLLCSDGDYGAHRNALTVEIAGGGTVDIAGSEPHEACSTTCQRVFDSGTSITLTATPGADQSFGGWSGDCSGTTPTCVLTMTANRRARAVFTPAQAQTGPAILYTDALSGPTSGGEGDAGAYLSVFGKNFGSVAGLGTTTKVFIGNCEVANYRHLSPAKTGAKLGTQHLAVQVGALCGAAMGTPQPVKVVVNGVASNTDHSFTPNPGRMLFVSLAGDDATAVAGNIAKPWRHLQTASRGGAYGSLRAGDHVVIRGGNWTDTGYEGAWLRFRDPQQQGSVASGANPSGWIHITAYPGPAAANAPEDVQYSTPGGVKGGIHGANSAYAGTTGDWVSISNLRLDVSATATSDAAPINQQYGTGVWRVVNNELGPWPSTPAAPNNAKAGGVSGHGDGTAILGNHIHDIACGDGAFENHGIYVDTDGQNWDIGYNWIHDIPGGNLIQLHDSVGGVTGIIGSRIHHNWLENSGKYGLNLANAALTGAIWNNVVIGAKFSGLRIDTMEQGLDWTIAFNTVYDNDRSFSGSGNAHVLNTWGAHGAAGTIRIYDNIFAAGPHTITGGDYYVNSGESDVYMDFKRNLWWDNGYGWSAFSCDLCSPDSLALYGDPKFTAAGAGNLKLLPASPAVGTGTQSVPITVADDFTALVARPAAGNRDLGAYELP
jgi:hypothetical protein